MDFEKEGINIEYKKAKSALPDDFWETYSAFANTKGGYVYLGVTEEPKGVFHFTGVKDVQKIVVELTTTSRNLAKVSKNLIFEDNIKEIEEDGKTVIEVYIPEADKTNKPVYLGGNQMRAFIRVNEADQKMDLTELRYFVSEAGNAFDGEPIIGFGVDDVNIKDVRTYQAIVAEREQNPSLVDMPVQEFLDRVGLLKKDRQSGKDEKYLTVAGLLFFGKFNSITEKFPSFHLDFMRKTSSANPDYQDRVVTSNFDNSPENIFAFYQAVEQKLNATIENPFVLDSTGFQRTDPGSLLIKSLREAMTNALSHAYYKSPKGISIYQFPDYIEFTNPGELRVTKEQFIFGGATEPRNPQLVLLFRRAGWSDRGGTGGPRIFEISDTLNLKTPDIQSANQETVLRIWKIDFYSGIKDEFELNEYETMILNYLRESESKIATATELKKLIPSKHFYDETVGSLIEKNLIGRGGKGRGTFYALLRPDRENAHDVQKLLRTIEDNLVRKK